MDRYLVEYEDDAGQRDVVFLDSVAKLAQWLKDHLRDAHEAQTEPAIYEIMRYDGDGHFTLLDLNGSGSRSGGDDYLYWDYIVTELESYETLFTFTIRIDGLA